MKVYTMNDGSRIEARTPDELVKRMREVSFSNGSVKSFMHDVAERAKMQNHTANIPTTNARDFVQALLEIGFIKMVEDNE